MARNDNQTRPTDVPVERFLAEAATERRRDEGVALLDIFRRETGDDGVMWGPSIVGFGVRHYRTDAGREGDWPVVGFSPRKSAITLYGLHNGYDESPDPLLADLGPHRTGVGCLYLTRLDALDHAVLRRMIREAWAAGGR